MKKIIIGGWFLFFWGLAGGAAAVSGIVFTTEPQSVPVNEISGPWTVSSGEAPGETSDLFLVSSSPSGQFSSSASNWEGVSKITWNSNWSNRNFYYRDSANGNPTITATLTTRNTHQSWTATQAITVGSGGSPAGEEAGSGDEETGSDETEVTAYAGAAALSKPAKASKPLAVDPGRRRLVSVGVPVSFRAKVTGGASDGRSQLVHWSFGDGEAALGREVSHAYYFPGTYIVMINVNQAEDEAVGEVKVEVVEPKAAVGEIGLTPRPYVQIVNQSAKELNLGYWQLRAGERTLTLPADTLIAPNAKINIPVEPAKLNLAGAPALELVYPNGRVIDQKPGPAAIPTLAIPTIKALNQRLETLVKKPVPVAKSLKVEAPSLVVAPVPADLTATPTPTKILVLPKPESVWSRALNTLF